MVDPIIVQFAFDNATRIPLEVTQTTAQNGFQFWMNIVIAGFAMIYFVILMLAQVAKGGLAKIVLTIFKKVNKTNHLMVIKHTNREMFSQSMIDQNTMTEVQEALTKFNGKPFDLIMYTPGGDIFSAEYISRLFKQYPGKIRSFVPIYAMSGGTYLALSTNEIYMNDYASLGATDPQLGTMFSFGSAKGWQEVMRLKKGKANDQSIIMAMMGKQYTKTGKDNVNALLMDKMPNASQRKALVELLTDGQLQHAFPMTKSFLNTYGLKIKDIPNEMNLKLLKLIKKMKEGVTYA